MANSRWTKAGRRRPEEANPCEPWRWQLGIWRSSHSWKLKFGIWSFPEAWNLRLGISVLLALTASILIAPSHAADKNGVSPNSISLPKGPGAIEGLGESFQ